MYPTPSARGTLTPRHRYSNPGDQGPEGAANPEEGLDPVQEVAAGWGYPADTQQGPYPQGDEALPMCTLEVVLHCNCRHGPSALPETRTKFDK